MSKFVELSGSELSGDTHRVFVFENEGHTLGNALQSVISSYPEVQSCGYSIPHPAEPKMYLHIRTHKMKAIDILRKGLEDLEKICNHTLETFEAQMNDFRSKQTDE